MDYLYDGTFDGLLTAIFYAYSSKEPCQIFCSTNYQPSLLHPSKFITTEEDKAARIYQSVLHKLSHHTYEQLYITSLSASLEAPTLALNYLRLCYQEGAAINEAKQHPIIHDIDRLVKAIYLEMHRYLGFVRFKEIAPVVFYGRIEPVNDILPIMIEHFQKRFADQAYMIHDSKRQKLLIYNKKESFIQFLTPEESTALLNQNFDDPFESLFKTYYEATTIADRLNLRQRNAFIPRRFRRFLTEL